MSDRGSPRGQVLLERSRSLPPEPASAGAARRLLRETLREAGREEWLDAGELAISEVVTNATLHAHTTIDLRIGVFPDEVCVEVRDRNPVPPVARHYDREATTGRGMGLVAVLARSCGVELLGKDGKVVWFCVGEPADAPEDGAGPELPISGWDAIAEHIADGSDESTESVQVVLRSMPATLWLAARQHHDSIMRELVLYLAEHEGVDADVAAADRARSSISSTLVLELERRGVLTGGVADPSSARELGALDLVIPVPADDAPSFAVLQDVLDLAESLAVAGELFTRPALPEIVAVRDWACEQVIAQLAGAPPAPWPGTAREQFETSVHDRAGAEEPDWDAGVVTDAPGALVAADDANRIIAVSRAFADLVGWPSEDLVGRRIVTLVPPRLREAHVAGFSRHLSTGEAHVLGVPVEVPVLTRSGIELPCRLLIEQAPATTGRAVYVGRFEPLQPS